MTISLRPLTSLAKKMSSPGITKAIQGVSDMRHLEDPGSPGLHVRYLNDVQLEVRKV